MKKILLTSGVVTVMILFGYYQENVKVAMNYRIALSEKYPWLDELPPHEKAVEADKLTPDTTIDYYYGHERIFWLNRFSLHELRSLKWGLTVAFTGAFLLLNGLLAVVMSQDIAGMVKRLALFYALLFCSALLVYLSGRLVGFPVEAYNVSRKMVGFLQSPMPFFVIWLSHTLRKRNEFNQ